MKTAISLVVLLSLIGVVTSQDKPYVPDAEAIAAEALRLMKREDVQGMALAVIDGLGLGVVAESRLSASLDRPPDLPVVEWNDNLVPAGTIAGDVLDLRLEVVRSMWKLLGDEHAGVEILAFREFDSAPQNPGPMIRVPEGTEIRVSVGNPLEVKLVVHGLSARKGTVMDSLVVLLGTRPSHLTKRLT